MEKAGNKYDLGLLRRHLEARVKMTDAQAEDLCAAFDTWSVRRKQLLIRPGEPVRYRYFVLSGCLRALVADENGEEQTLQFAVEDWWITDYISYLEQKAAKMTVVALEDTVVARISYQKEQMLKAQAHCYESFFRRLAEGTAKYMYQRVINGLTLNAEERYESFLRSYPQLAERVPQYALASFLGMTTEYLSKIRKLRVSK